MKHDHKITLYLVALFFITQLFGLFVLNHTIEEVSNVNGTITVRYEEPITGRPELEEEESFNYILVMILAGTLILLALIKFRLFKIWKAWFFLAIFGALTITISVFIREEYAIAISLVLTYLKVYRPNAIIHNITEVFIYSGIALLLSPLFTVFWCIMLLLAISVYDAFAVWQSKHMITLAKAQSENKMFAGLVIPYKLPGKSKKEKTPGDVKVELRIPKDIQDKSIKSAILGGGDVAFPLIFAGSVMTFLIQSGMSRQMAYFKALFIPLFAGIALYLLFLKSEKGKFYPAMPFLTAGCLIGYGIVLIL